MAPKPVTFPMAPEVISSRMAGRACDPKDWNPTWQAMPARSTPSAIRA